MVDFNNLTMGDADMLQRNMRYMRKFATHIYKMCVFTYICNK